MRPAMPQVVQFPMAQQSIPVQVPIQTANGQTVYQTIHMPIQSFGGQMPGLMQPQMQLIPQYTQVANIITPNGQIQQVQLAPVNPLNLQAAQAQAAAQQQQQQNVLVQQAQPTMSGVNTQTSNALVTSVPSMSVQGNANGQLEAQQAQPITITNAQGQQITVIPTQSLQQLRPNNNTANIIQMPNIPGLQAFPIQNIPGLGNVQVGDWFLNLLVFYYAISLKSRYKKNLDKK